MVDFQPSSQEQLTEQELKAGYWWVTHRARVKRAAVIFLIVLDAALVGYGAYGWLDWAFLSGARERANIAASVQSFTDYEFFRQANAPKDLVIESPVVLPSGNGAYDLLARVRNPNAGWWAEIAFRFPGAGEALRNAFVLPGENAYLHRLGLVSDTRPATARPELVEVRWRRVDPHVARPDYATWSAERLQLSAEQVTFAPPAPGTPVPSSAASFTLVNGSAFGYREVGVTVVLLSGTKIIAANAVTLDRIRAGERRSVEVRWFSDISGVSRVEVRPRVNIFDAQSYLAPGE